MPTFTEVLNLRKPEENDFYNEQTEQAENWQKVDDYAKQTNNNKLDKGDVPVKYDTAEKIGIELDKKQNIEDNELITNAKTIVGAINENYEKFKNFCPFPVNSIFLSLDNSNPATLFLGTTWEKVEERFLLGSSSTYALGSTGGSATTTLTEANMPRHRHQVDSFSVTTAKHKHPVTGGFGYGSSLNQIKTTSDNTIATAYTDEAGGGNTGTASPYTSYVGSGTPFNNMPPYLVVNIWKRLS